MDAQPASGKVAIVTGGAGAGIGRGITMTLLSAGWRVIVVDVDERAAAEMREELSAAQRDAVRTLVADLREPQTADDAVKAAVELGGRLDGLVNCAGVGLVEPLERVSAEDVDRLFAINVKAQLMLAKSAIGELRKTRGAIVNIGSIHARATTARYATYAATKGAVESLTRGLACEFGPSGVRVNCVLPGLVDSPQTRRLLRPFTDDPDRWIERYTNTQQLLPWPATPGDIGSVVQFLLSGASRCITGQSIVVDQGSLAMTWPREAEQAHGDSRETQA